MTGHFIEKPPESLCRCSSNKAGFWGLIHSAPATRMTPLSAVGIRLGTVR
jgi:hypothetical protein